MSKKKRIVITGIGVISPIGLSKDIFWENLFEGRSAFKPITLFDTSSLKVKIGGEITNFNAKSILGDQGLIDLDRATLLLLSATKCALDDAKISITEASSKEIGVTIGTTFGSLYSISAFDREALKEGPRYVNPSVFPSTVGNAPASRISIRFNIKGSNTTISTGMCAALDAIDYDCDRMQLGRSHTMISGSLESFSVQTFLGFYKLNYLAGIRENSESISCPFDRRRNGILLSEGSVVFVLEELNSALSRNASPYAEILGVGSCFDPSRFYRYNPKGEGMIRAMKLAMKDSDVKPAEVNCILANANSTKDADLIESLAIKEAFGSSSKKIPVTAIKSILGETFSASGGFATVAAIGALQKNSIPPIINYKEADPSCDLNFITNTAKRQNVDTVMVNTFSPSGANTSLIIGKFNKN